MHPVMFETEGANEADSSGPRPLDPDCEAYFLLLRPSTANPATAA